MKLYSKYFLVLFSLLFSILQISAIIITLIMTDELRDNEKIDLVKVNFVYIVNWIFAGLYILVILLWIVVMPFIYRYKYYNNREIDKYLNLKIKKRN